MAKVFTAAPAHINEMVQKLVLARNQYQLALQHLKAATNCERWRGEGVNRIREFIDAAENNVTTAKNDIQFTIDDLNKLSVKVTSLISQADNMAMELANDLQEDIFAGIAVTTWNA
jgi:uncharacterized phage infection (PIP) family protein YhgE